MVPISTRLGAFLKQYIQDRQRLGKQCESFFTTAQYDHPLPGKSVDRLTRRLREKLGLHFTAHSLRHTFATLMLEGGCDIYTLARLLGHSKITTTTIYLTCTARMMASSVEKHPLN